MSSTELASTVEAHGKKIAEVAATKAVVPEGKPTADSASAEAFKDLEEKTKKGFGKVKQDFGKLQTDMESFKTTQEARAADLAPKLESAKAEHDALAARFDQFRLEAEKALEEAKLAAQTPPPAAPVQEQAQAAEDKDEKPSASAI